MPASAVPAAPATRHPLLDPPHRVGKRLQDRTRAADLRLLFLGLSPVAAATAMILAGSGVRSFTILDPTEVTWEDAYAGAYDLPDIGAARDHKLRQRLLAANPQAVASSHPSTFPAPTCPGTLIIRSRSSTEDCAQAPITPYENHLLLDLITAQEHPPGSALLWPVRPWYARACQQCIRTALEVVTPQETSRIARYEAWPAHTALAAAITAQHVLSAATTGNQNPITHPTLLIPGAPCTQITELPAPQLNCALCAP